MKAKQRLDSSESHRLDKEPVSGSKDDNKQERSDDKNCIGSRMLKKSSTMMISRTEALRELMKQKVDENLPEVLRENKLKADPLLFKECQANYQKRRKVLQRQIVVDNLHFCYQQKILAHATADADDEDRARRNSRVKELAK